MAESKIVPVEPDEEQLQAAMELEPPQPNMHGVFHPSLVRDFATDIYKAMIARCPDAPSAAELEGLRADAARYRWLRVNPVHCAGFADNQTYGRNKNKPEIFDAAVDIEMAADAAFNGAAIANEGGQHD